MKFELESYVLYWLKWDLNIYSIIENITHPSSYMEGMWNVYEGSINDDDNNDDDERHINWNAYIRWDKKNAVFKSQKNVR